mmetsp:Transcript_78816/g.198034  ORF Transcript_78816/g.198034 Transcript_78816/m.198034 type:complete len:488 (+) Transcript_78816:35-1498(+)
MPTPPPVAQHSLGWVWFACAPMGGCKSCGTCGEAENGELQVENVRDNDLPSHRWLSGALMPTPVPSDLPPLEDTDLVEPSQMMPTTNPKSPRGPPQQEPQPEHQPALEPLSTPSPVASAKQQQQEVVAAGSLADVGLTQHSRDKGCERAPSGHQLGKATLKSFVGEAVSAPKSSKKSPVVSGMVATSGSVSRRRQKNVEALPVATTKASFAPLCTYEYIAAPSRMPVAATTSTESTTEEKVSSTNIFSSVASTTPSATLPLRVPPSRCPGLSAEASPVSVVTLSIASADPMEKMEESKSAKAWHMRPSVGTWLQVARPSTLQSSVAGCYGGATIAAATEGNQQHEGRKDDMTERSAVQQQPAEITDPVFMAKSEDVEPLVILKEKVMSNLPEIVSKTTSDSTPSVWTECSPSEGSPADSSYTPQSSSSSVVLANPSDVADVLSEPMSTIMEVTTPDETLAAKLRFERLPSVGTWLTFSLKPPPEENF